ncbi:MAG: HDOD domain-containing protein [Gammaproteobacteria bacterium]
MINQEILNKLNQIPPLPPVVLEVLNLINSNEDIDFYYLEKKIIRDSALTGRILSLANSSFFGMPGEIISVKDACLVLGINTIRNLVLTSAVMNKFKDDYGNNLDFRKIWEHGVGAAAAAKVYSNKLGVNVDTAFISGLLHDIGKLIIDYYFPDLYKSVIEYKNDEDCPFFEAEQKIMGTDHSEIGALVCESWMLPIDICNVIRSHHNAVDINSAISLTDIIVISDITSHGLGYDTVANSVMPIKDDSIFKKQGINTKLIEDNLSVIQAITESYISNNI